MKFIDEAVITVESGSGGPGCVSFRRERFIPKGGPDGGDGGRGGSVVFAASLRRRTLADFRYRRHLKAERGKGGQGACKTGRAGEDLLVEVPAGTVVTDADTGELIHDFTETDRPIQIAAGGRGGQGNARFKSATHRTPRFAQPGEPGVIRRIRLELKLLADVGIMGFPNAGKSTLIRQISSARPKVADYPFTTLIPTLGVVEPPGRESFVVADIPGLIDGAHAGAGLGTRFLRHVERTRLLVHLIDVTAIDPDDPLSRLRAINHELAQHNPELVRKPQIVVLNKMDLPEAGVASELFQMAAGDMAFLEISAATGRGVDSLINHLIERLDD